MESLYTKYRPKTFEEVVGQQHVVSTLERAVLEGAVSHAYLFCGPRGTGKTTMARILAKALLCEQGAGHLPDGTCDDCRLVAAGAHPDVVEIDAASNTGVENVRDVIIGRVNYAPVRGAYKVYIVDEVHMLTIAAFNALLKTLEEPPSNVVFILCTTDPQKIPATILSRVQRFDFHAIGPADMTAHLADVCAAEGITTEPEALELVVRQAHGGMRDALTALEQLATMTGRNVTLAAARDLFGETSETTLAVVTKALAQRDVATLFEQVARLVDAGRDLLQFVRELASHVRDVYVVSALGTTEGVVRATGSEAQALRAEADAFGSTDRLARALTVLGDAASEMRTAPNQQLVLEIAFTRLVRPESDLTLEALAERVAALEGRLAQGVPMVAAAPQPQPAARGRSETAAGEMRPRAVGGPTPQRPARPQGVTSPQGQASQPTQAPAAPQAVPQPQAPNAQPQPPQWPQSQPQAVRQTDQGALQRGWSQVVDALVATNPSRGALLRTSTATADDGTTISVSLPKGSDFAMRMLARPDVRELVLGQVRGVFGPREIRYSEADLTPARQRQAPQPVDAAPATPKTRPMAPAPQPAPAAPPQAPGPQPAPEPMPWEPVPQAASSAPSDYVPAEGPWDYLPAEATPPQAPSVAPAFQQPQAPQQPPAPQQASAPQAPRQRTARPKRSQGTNAKWVMPEDLAAVTALLDETFGEGISYTMEPAGGGASNEDGDKPGD